MTAPQIDTIERFAWEGPLSLWQAIALGAVLAAVFAWTLWREGRLTHRWLMPLFWLFRAVTLAAVFWMLLGPTQVTVTRRSTPKSIVLIADGSGSMSVVDSPRPLEDTRWTIASQANPDQKGILAADRSAVAASAATEHFRAALALLERGSQSTDAQESLTASALATEKLIGHLQIIAEHLNNESSARKADELKQSATDLVAELQSAAELFDGTQVLAQDGIGRLHALLPRLEGLSRRTQPSPGG